MAATAFTFARVSGVTFTESGIPDLDLETWARHAELNAGAEPGTFVFLRASLNPDDTGALTFGVPD